MQLDLDLSKPLVLPEYNRNGNNEAYQANKGHFKSQTEIVLSHLLNGEGVTSLRMIKLHDIIDTRARIFSLKKSGYKIGERKVPGGNGSKEWFLENR